MSLVDDTSGQWPQISDHFYMERRASKLEAKIMSCYAMLRVSFHCSSFGDNSLITGGHACIDGPRNGLGQVDVELPVVVRPLHVLSFYQALDPLLDNDGAGLEPLVELLHYL